jgi:tetratricopeptide (TPR) repeat protein
MEQAVTVQGIGMEWEDYRGLMDLSLLESIQEEAGQLYYVHRLTAQYVLAGIEEAVRNKYHRQAGRYFESLKTKEGKKYLEDDIESRWHYLQAGEWDSAAEITFSLEDYLTLHGFPQRSMELLRELEDKALGDKNRAIVFHLIGILLQEFGHYNAALTQYQQSLEIAEKIGDIAGMAISMGQMGDLYLNQNHCETALKLLFQSFAIFAKIGSPNANQAKELIVICREKMTEEQFKAILKEFE